MKNLEQLLKVFSSLFFSGGGDPPSEAYWTGNEFLEWLEKEYDVEFNIRFDEPCKENNWEPNFEEVTKKLIETFGN